MKCSTCHQPMVRTTSKRTVEVWHCELCGARVELPKPMPKAQPVDPRRSKPI